MKQIKDFENYCVTDDGRVFNTKFNRELKTFNNRKTGYMQLMLHKNGNKYNKRVHRLVAEAYLENPKDLPLIDHKDDNKCNNRVDNLQWVTHKENYNLALESGAAISIENKKRDTAKRARHGRTNLTEEDVTEIKRLVDLKVKQKDIAKRFGTSQSRISDIKNGKTWR